MKFKYGMVFIIFVVVLLVTSYFPTNSIVDKKKIKPQLSTEKGYLYLDGITLGDSGDKVIEVKGENFVKENEDGSGSDYVMSYDKHAKFYILQEKLISVLLLDVDKDYFLEDVYANYEGIKFSSDEDYYIYSKETHHIIKATTQTPNNELYLYLLYPGPELLQNQEFIEAMKEDVVDIGEKEEIIPLFSLNYGEAENEIGVYDGLKTTSSIASFDVQKGLFYLLDNNNKKILIANHKGEMQSSLKIDFVGIASDILVDNEFLYVLDSLNEKVWKLSSAGEVIDEDTFSKVIAPRNLGKTKDGSIHVDEKRIVFQEEKYFKKEDLIYYVEKPSLTNAKIISYYGEVNIPFTNSNLGAINVLSLNVDQVVFTKYESMENEEKGLAHLYVTNNYGEILGAVKLPLQEMYYYIENYIRIDNEKIYMIISNKENLTIYELKPGKNYENR